MQVLVYSETKKIVIKQCSTSKTNFHSINLNDDTKISLYLSPSILLISRIFVVNQPKKNLFLMEYSSINSITKDNSFFVPNLLNLSSFVIVFLFCCEQFSIHNTLVWIYSFYLFIYISELCYCLLSAVSPLHCDFFFSSTSFSFSISIKPR